MDYSKIEKYYGSTSILNYIDEIENNIFDISNYYTQYMEKEFSLEFNFMKFFMWYKKGLGIIDILLKKIYYKKYYWRLKIKDNYIIIKNNNKQYKISFEELVDIRSLIDNKFKIQLLDEYKIIYYLTFYYLKNNQLKAIAVPYSGIKSLRVFVKSRHSKIMPESEKTYFVNVNDIVRLKSMFIRKNELNSVYNSTYKNIRKESNKEFEDKLNNSEKVYSSFVNKINKKLVKLMKIKKREEKFMRDMEDWENVKK